ncbi:PCYCGC motif-containing (lipo)protein [Ornithinibacillus salinisoli]|uniref:PCYCGC motif-containing (Lipo)protein n=1 Tax=Ornithinibacillus salinisoli TaxID=1848459 RepID=A0ABW4W2N7_9BACI
MELDSMGFGCNICIEIAETAVAKYEAGESLLDIRNFIDKTYSGSGVGPTPTPMPKGE